MGLLNLRFHRGEKSRVWSPVNPRTPPQETAAEAWEKTEEGEARRVKDYLKQHGEFSQGREVTHQTRAHRGGMRL